MKKEIQQFLGELSPCNVRVIKAQRKKCTIHVECVVPISDSHDFLLFLCAKDYDFRCNPEPGHEGEFEIWFPCNWF
jgi:hypothetical protein